MCSLSCLLQIVVLLKVTQGVCYRCDEAATGESEPGCEVRLEVWWIEWKVTLLVQGVTVERKDPPPARGECVPGPV